MRFMTRILILSTLCAVALSTVGSGGVAGAATRGSGGVVKRPVTFQVRNLNRSTLPCPSDGAAYDVKGYLIGPASDVGPGASGGRHSVTLYLHGFSVDESFWNFSAIPKYDYAAAMGRTGH